MSDLEISRENGVLRLTINREDKRNALSSEVLRAMLDGIRTAGEDPDVHAVLVGSVGDRIFCAGADLAIMSGEITGLEQHEGRSLVAQVVLAMRSCPVPVISRVQGICLAGGVGIAAGSDVVLAKDTAVFGLPEIDRGLWPFMVGTLMARHISPKHALDLMLTGDRFDAQTAYSIGLVSRVFPAASFDADVEAYVTRIAGLPPVAVRLGKASWISATETPSLDQALAAAVSQLSLITTTDDAAEGIASFFDKRPPVWTGR